MSETTQATSVENYPVPSVSTLQNVAKLSIVEDKPVFI